MPDWWHARRRYPDGVDCTSLSAADYFAGDLIGYTTGLLVTVLLLVLTLRAAKLPRTSLANIGFAACALLWTAGGLAGALMATLAPRGSRGALATEAIQYSGGAFPILILAIWPRARGGRSRSDQAKSMCQVQVPLNFRLSRRSWSYR